MEKESICFLIYIIGIAIGVCWLSYEWGAASEEDKNGNAFPCLVMCILVWPLGILAFPIVLVVSIFEKLGKKKNNVTPN